MYAYQHTKNDRRSKCGQIPHIMTVFRAAKADRCESYLLQGQELGPPDEQGQLPQQLQGQRQASLQTQGLLLGPVQGQMGRLESQSQRG